MGLLALLATGFTIEGSSLVYYEREAHDTRKGEVRTTLAIWSGDAGHGYQAKCLATKPSDGRPDGSSLVAPGAVGNCGSDPREHRAER